MTCQNVIIYKLNQAKKPQIQNLFWIGFKFNKISRRGHIFITSHSIHRKSVMFKITVSLFRSLGCWSSRSLHPPAMTWPQWGITLTKCYVYWQRSDLPITQAVVPVRWPWAPYWRWWSQRIFWSTCFSGISAEAWTLTARGHCSSCLRCSFASPSNLCCSTQPSSTPCLGCWEPVLTQNLVVLQRSKTAWYCCSIRYEPTGYTLFYVYTVYMNLFVVGPQVKYVRF